MQTRLIFKLTSKPLNKFQALAGLFISYYGYSSISENCLNKYSALEWMSNSVSGTSILNVIKPKISKKDSLIYTTQRKKLVHDSDDSESDVEDFHTPSLDSDTENEFIDDDSGFLVETDSEEEFVTSADDTDSENS